jgi:hypothetical protein
MTSYETCVDAVVIGPPMWAHSGIDWEHQKTEILKYYRGLVQIDTRGGNETKAVECLRCVLEGNGTAHCRSHPSTCLEST